jgi:hypothetical protein
MRRLNDEMAYGQALRFQGGTMDMYDAVKSELGWDGGEQNKPEGLLAHAAGATDDGFLVIEWWNSQQDWDRFFAERLRPAFEKVGDIPQPQQQTFEVHASYPV